MCIYIYKQGLARFGDNAPMVESNMGKNMDNEMESLGRLKGLYGWL